MMPTEKLTCSQVDRGEAAGMASQYKVLPMKKRT